MSLTAAFPFYCFPYPKSVLLYSILLTWWYSCPFQIPYHVLNINNILNDIITLQYHFKQKILFSCWVIQESPFSQKIFVLLISIYFQMTQGAVNWFKSERTKVSQGYFAILWIVFISIHLCTFCYEYQSSKWNLLNSYTIKCFEKKYPRKTTNVEAYHNTTMHTKGYLIGIHEEIIRTRTNVGTWWQVLSQI